MDKSIKKKKKNVRFLTYSNSIQYQLFRKLFHSYYLKKNLVRIQTPMKL